ncbi:hypothetical protein V5O48_018469 [Marasmius crinis-equi]|uniref:BTB domain-containing protein n=1 Tax=Marasmius crinis-equi TaxID=585013 RepID=A0ABR3EL68_9AGAR
MLSLPRGLSEKSSQTLSKHSQLYLETIVFQIENTLFRVPSRYFHEHSEVFKSASNISKNDDHSVEQPIELSPLPHGANAEDFGYLARIIIVLTAGFAAPNEYGLLQWLSVLKLASAWEFIEIRELAMARIRNFSGQGPGTAREKWLSVLEFCWDLPTFSDLRDITISCLSRSSGVPAIEQVVLGRRYLVKSWLIKGLKGLGTEPALPPLDQLKRDLGTDLTLQLLYFRDYVSTHSCKYNCHDSRRGHGEQSKYVDKVEEYFPDELSRYDKIPSAAKQ